MSWPISCSAMTHEIDATSGQEILDRYRPFYVRALSWKIGHRVIDPRLGALIVTMALYAVGIALAWVAGDRFQVLQVRAYHAGTVSFFVGTFLLTDAYRRTRRAIGAVLDLCPSHEHDQAVIAGVRKMYRSPWQYVACGLGVGIFLVLMFFLRASELPLSLPLRVYALVTGAFVVFFIFPGAWLAGSSAAFVLRLSRRSDLRLMSCTPGSTQALGVISSWIGTMSMYFAIEAVVLIMAVLLTDWPNSSVHAGLMTTAISVGTLVMVVYLVLPQVALARAVRNEKQRQIAQWAKKIRDLDSAPSSSVVAGSLLAYSQLIQATRARSESPLFLAGSLKALFSVILPFVLLYPEYRDFLSAIVTALKRLLLGE